MYRARSSFTLQHVYYRISTIKTSETELILNTYMVTPTSTGGPVNRKFMPHHENQIKLVPVCALGLPTYAPLEGARGFRARFGGRGTINMNISILAGAVLVSGNSRQYFNRWFVVCRSVGSRKKGGSSQVEIIGTNGVLCCRSC